MKPFHSRYYFSPSLQGNMLIFMNELSKEKYHLCDLKFFWCKQMGFGGSILMKLFKYTFNKSKEF